MTVTITADATGFNRGIEELRWRLRRSYPLLRALARRGKHRTGHRHYGTPAWRRRHG